MAHHKIWRQAQKKVAETVNRIKKSVGDLSRDREDLEQRIIKMRGEVRNAGSQDRQFLLSDLAFLLEDEARLESRIQGMGAGLSSPYFSKIVSDEAYYIIKGEIIRG